MGHAQETRQEWSHQLAEKIHDVIGEVSTIIPGKSNHKNTVTRIQEGVHLIIHALRSQVGLDDVNRFEWFAPSSIRSGFNGFVDAGIVFARLVEVIGN